MGSYTKRFHLNICQDYRYEYCYIQGICSYLFRHGMCQKYFINMLAFVSYSTETLQEAL